MDEMIVKPFRYVGWIITLIGVAFLLTDKVQPNDIAARMTLGLAMVAVSYLIEIRNTLKERN